MATDHIDYLLELAQRSKGQAFVAKLDDQLVGFLIVVIESVDEGDVHLIERYRRMGLSPISMLPKRLGIKGRRTSHRRR